MLSALAKLSAVHGADEASERLRARAAVAKDSETERLMEKARGAFDEPEDPTDELTRALAWWSHQPAQVL